MERRLTPRGRERRRQLLDAAAARFAAGGYHATSVADVVDAVGVGKGVFYWYFDSKDALMTELLREAQLDLRRCQQHAIADEADPIRRIELGIRASFRWFAAHRDLVQLFQLASVEDRFAATLRESEDVAIADVARHVKEAIIEGLVPGGDPVVLAEAALGVTTRLAQRFVHARGEDADTVANAAVRFCLGGLRGDGGAEPGR